MTCCKMVRPADGWQSLGEERGWQGGLEAAGSAGRICRLSRNLWCKTKSFKVKMLRVCMVKDNAVVTKRSILYFHPVFSFISGFLSATTT